MSQSSSLQDLLRTLITANHILHYYNIVDGFGHISIRHPDPSKQTYIMPGYLAPALVHCADDLIEYHISDGSPVDPNAKKGYSERFIHGEIFKRFPSINCVIHSHSEAVLPFMIAGVPMRPAFHMAGFLGADVPMFDITKIYEAGDQQDMLVNNVKFGSALASHFAENTADSTSPLPDHLVVLMRHHGFTTLGESIQDAVYRAMYTQTNASILSTAANLRSSFYGPALTRESGAAQGSDGSGLDLLSASEMAGCRNMNEATADKAFRLWVREVEVLPLYVNELAEK
ncbi:arad-like aldolase/epimerase [Glonium stellatum]|uniref:Arad-like aldolase/epimerase n=1 Tax=Glonium stellatum TaxID=574774 RepID=A0A8E2JYX2_9PEZI|nr:arad-like aldolase/epimerase [Glonium stellatum]